MENRPLPDLRVRDPRRLALIYPGSLVWGRSLLALEMIMLTAFGLSWFVKGQKVLSGSRT
jgi:hypothetical protein